MWRSDESEPSRKVVSYGVEAFVEGPDTRFLGVPKQALAASMDRDYEVSEEFVRSTTLPRIC